jgi:hypothetical protein
MACHVHIKILHKIINSIAKKISKINTTQWKIIIYVVDVSLTLDDVILRGFIQQENYTDRATAACRRS